MESKFLKHTPCSACGSSDARAEYTDHAYCFSCERFEGVGEDGSVVRRTPDGLLQVRYTAITARRLTYETCRKFGYGISRYGGQPVQVAPYYDSKLQLVGQKVRTKTKGFSFLGSAKKSTLFGQQLWRDGGKMLIITEGEIDAMSVSQVQENRWPVVSVPNGAAGAAEAIRKNLEWVELFDTVVFMFDMDEPGQAAARACAEVLSPDKAKIASLPLKDANEMLMAGRGHEILDAAWGAKVFRPDGIVSGDEIWDTLRSYTANFTPFPWQEFNDALVGMRAGEILTLAAGTGVGKSLVCRELAHHLISGGTRVGYIALEESVRRSAQGLLSVAMNRPLHLTLPDDYTEDLWEEVKKHYDHTLADGRVFFFDHWGSIQSDKLVSKIRYMAKGLGCRFVFLDHISIVVSGRDETNERKSLDVTMTKLRSLVQESGIGLVLVSHLRRPEGSRGHEEGLSTSISHLRGTAGIGQLSDTVIGLERNQQGEDDKHLTTARCLKDRLTGFTGVIGKLEYDADTGRLAQYADASAFEPEF